MSTNTNTPNAHLQGIIDRANRLRSQHTRLRVSLDRIQQIEADVDRRFAALMEDDVFKWLPADHHKKVRADLHRELMPGRKVLAGVLLFDVSRTWPALDTDIRHFREHCKQPPGAVDAYLARSGGTRLHLSDETELLIQVLDEQRRGRFREELRDAQPSTVAALYSHAVQADTDAASTLMVTIESLHGAGWAGLPPSSDQELASAKELRRLIADTQERRVPAELDVLLGEVQETSILANRATQLYDIAQINLDQRADFQCAYEDALREQEADQS